MLGVSWVVPLLTEPTVMQPSAKKVERWMTIAREAAEQCERVFVPEVLEPLAWIQWLQRSIEGVRWMAAARENAKDIPYLLECDRYLIWGGIAVAIAPAPECDYCHWSLSQWRLTGS